MTYDESFTITLTDVNEAPFAGDDAFSGDQLEELIVPAGQVTLNDFGIDGDAITVVLVDAPENGTVVLNADGSFAYTPEAVFSGKDTFTYQASDGVLTSNVATVEITVITTISGGGNPGGPTSPPAPEEQTDPNMQTTTDDVDNTDPVEGEDVPAAGGRIGSSGTGEENDEDQNGPAAITTFEQSVRQTKSELFVAIFLDEIPESELKQNDKREARREQLQSTEAGLNGQHFLFSQITSVNPSFMESTFHLTSAEFVEQREREMRLEILFDKVVIGSAAILSKSVSVGYVVWMLKSGSLLASFVSSLPAWQSFDPLAILDEFHDPVEDELDQETLLDIVNR